jgi:sRNA-binding carbon storage regulator CsrA
VRLGIVAPPEVSIRREELAARMALPTDAAPTAFAAR